LGIPQKTTNTIMKNLQDRIDLAVEVIEFGLSLFPQ
jgi:hypothetical protein